MTSYALSNFDNRTQTDHKQHLFLLVAGGSGIGKSRLGYEAGRPDVLLSHLPAGADTRLRASLRNPCYVHINFNNGEKFDVRVDGRPESQRLGIRLATAGLLHTSFDTFVTKCPNLSVITVASVLTELVQRRLREQENMMVCIVVHLDEFQFYIDAARKASKKDPRQCFKDMLNVLGQFMREGATDIRGRFFILPIVTGTSAIDISFLPTEYSGKTVCLAPLSEQATETMCTAVLGAKQISAEEFRVARADCGGIPHYLGVLLAIPWCKDGVNWGATLFDKMKSLVLDDFGGVEGAVAVVQFAIACQRVTRDFVMPGGSTVGELERKGSLFLVGQGLLTIHLPFVVLKKLNLLLTQHGRPVLDDNLLFFPTAVRPWRWQDFEELHAHLQAVRINALMAAQAAEIEAAKDAFTALHFPLGHTEDLAQIRSRLAKTTTAKKKIQELDAERDRGFQLSTILPGALARQSVLSMRVRPHAMRCYHEKNRFLVSTTGEVAVVDSVECREGKVDLLSGVFLAAKNNVLFDGRFVCPGATADKKGAVIFWQNKHSESDTKNNGVSAREVSIWHGAAHGATKLWHSAYDVVLLYVTNRLLIGSLSVEEFEGLAVVSREQLHHYLSATFSVRGLIAD